MPVRPGDRLGPYEIIESLGSGGMGLVYKARDSRLDREVAIKILAPNLTRDPAAKARFIQEAKAASALDHPAICTVYDVGETSDGQLYLAMAFYTGGTLKARIARGPLEVEAALDVAIDLADGLAEAHRRGILHRDIKPSNVMFSASGQAKLVDFGLAKLAGRSDITQTGAMLGTVGYMSPEQMRGDALDPRADIWALGAVLYEMVAGTPPFKGSTYVAVVVAVDTRPPEPLTTARAGVPLELERIVQRALQKHPDHRYQTAADLCAELRRLKASLDHTSVVMGVPALHQPELRLPRVWQAAAIAGALAVGVLLGYLLLAGRTPVDVPPRLANATQITQALGVEDYPAWSPDGRTLAYAANVDSDLYGGNWDIWVTQVGAGDAVNRTADHSGDDRFPAWSPDGRQIAFWSSREGGGYFVMSALGGPPRRVIATGGIAAAELGPPRWSPDGTRLAGVLYDQSAPFVDIVTLADGQSERVALPGLTTALDFNWSPDGRHFAFVNAANISSQVSDLPVIDRVTGARFQLTDGRSNVWSPQWSADGRSLYYVSNRLGSMDLWQQRLLEDGTPDGAPRVITSGIEMMRAAVAPDGRRVAYSRGRRMANLWRIPILQNRVATWADAQQLTFDRAFIEFVDVSRDGKTVLFDSDRNGNPDLWMLESDGSEMRQLTADPTPDWAPRWSPDRTAIAFYSYRAGNRDLWIMPADGGAPRQLTEHPASDLVPGWSPDGTELAFTSLRGGNPDIWVMPAAGGEARRLTDDPGEDRRADWSPDGRWVSFVSSRAGALTLWRVPTAGGAPERLTQGTAYYARWAPDSRTLYFTAQNERSSNLWALSLEDRVERPVTDLSGRRGSTGDLALATDGRYLYFTWEEDIGDIWVADLERDDGSVQ